MRTHASENKFYTSSKESSLSGGIKLNFLGRDVSESAHQESKCNVSLFLSPARVMQLESATVAGENCTFTFTGATIILHAAMRRVH